MAQLHVQRHERRLPPSEANPAAVLAARPTAAASFASFGRGGGGGAGAGGAAGLALVACGRRRRQCHRRLALDVEGRRDRRAPSKRARRRCRAVARQRAPNRRLPAPRPALSACVTPALACPPLRRSTRPGSPLRIGAPSSVCTASSSSASSPSPSSLAAAAGGAAAAAAAVAPALPQSAPRRAAALGRALGSRVGRCPRPQPDR